MTTFLLNKGSLHFQIHPHLPRRPHQVLAAADGEGPLPDGSAQLPSRQANLSALHRKLRSHHRRHYLQGRMILRFFKDPLHFSYKIQLFRCNTNMFNIPSINTKYTVNSHKLCTVLLRGAESHKIFPRFLTGAATSIHSAIYRWFAPQSPVKILGQGEREQLG